MTFPDLSRFDLTGKVALVTGGGYGIGAGLSLGLAQAGAEVVIAARDAARANDAIDRLREQGLKAHYLPLDLADPESCRALVPATIAQYGRLDILVNNAGMAITKTPQDTSLEEWHATIDTNLTGAFLLCQGAYPEFVRLGAGKIINIGSIATKFGSAHAAAYCASKGGIGQLTMALASAWGADNIQVNALLPGYIETELVAKARAERPEFDRRITDRTPMRRFGKPDDLAGATVFLASSASDFVTGTLIPVDGGYMSQL